MCVAWAASGPFFGFSDTWQLVINTSTTVLTFLMVLLIQNTQNRNSKAVQLKLDELLHTMRGTNEHLIDIEEATDDEIELAKAVCRERSQRPRNGDLRPVTAQGGKSNTAG